METTREQDRVPSVFLRRLCFPGLAFLWFALGATCSLTDAELVEVAFTYLPQRVWQMLLFVFASSEIPSWQPWRNVGIHPLVLAWSFLLFLPAGIWTIRPRSWILRCQLYLVLGHLLFPYIFGYFFLMTASDIRQ